MDKETLSNYGWIVIAVLVLAVMIALATPFGNFIADAVKSTTKGLFSASQNALNSVGVPGLNIEDQEFDVPGNDTQEVITIGNAGATIVAELICYDEDCYDHGTSCFTSCNEVVLTWDELGKEENGQKYGYDANYFQDTENINIFLFGCYSIKNLTLPSTAKSINMFSNISKIQNIYIPKSVNQISISDEGGSLENIFVETGNENYCSVNGVLYSKDMKTLLSCPNGKSGIVTVPSTVEHIADGAFAMINSINVVLPEGLKTIGKSAFIYCQNITVNIPTTVLTIDDDAFYNCELTEINLPTSVTKIGKNAFNTGFGSLFINYSGTLEQFNQIEKDIQWSNTGAFIDGTLVFCTDKTYCVNCDRVCEENHCPSCLLNCPHNNVCYHEDICKHNNFCNHNFIEVETDYFECEICQYDKDFIESSQLQYCLTCNSIYEPYCRDCDNLISGDELYCKDCTRPIT